ncbi:MAG: transcription initiation factor IIB [Ignavibacteriales bacterium]
MNKQSIQHGKYILYEYPATTVQDSERQSALEVNTNSRICPSCKSNGTIFDGLTGEIICTTCGTVVLDKQEIPVSDINAKSRSGMPSSLVFPDKGLSTVITYSNTDANGTLLNQEQITTSNKIRYLDKIWGNNKNHLRNFKNAFAIMSTVTDKLGLTNPVIERAAYYYRKAFDSKLIKGRAIKEMVVASIYAACKEMSIPRTLQEISYAANAEPIFSGRCYRIMSRKLRISPTLVDATSYISKISTNAQISQQTYREAVSMLSVAKKNPICYGKDPKAVAAAVLYACCLKRNEADVSQSKIATAGNISIVTLRKRLADILKIFPEANYMKARNRMK